MKALIETDVHAFADRVLPWVAREPVVNNVLAGNVEAVRDGRRHYEGAIWLTALDEAGEVVGAAMQTPPHKLFVCPMPEDAVRALAQALRGVRPELIGVVGVVDTAAAFTREWQQATGATVATDLDERLYALGTLAPPANVAGRQRAALPPDRELLTDWSLAFHHEAMGGRPADPIPEVVERRIAEGSYHLWEEDGRAVCLAGVSLPSAGVSRIGPVYTPPEHRRHGYGSACVASASQHALDAGAEACMLYTDLANATSNAIYQAIGYRPLCDARQYSFSYPTDA